MTWVAVAIGGSALVGAAASTAAANKQSGAIENATDAQGKQLAVSRSDLAPYRSAGQSALQALLTRLGLGSGVSTDDKAYKDSYNNLVAQFEQAHQAKYGMSIFDPRADAGSREEALTRLREQAMEQASQSVAKPEEYGSLLKPFTGADLAEEPGYKFGLTEGEKAINNLAASRGSYFGGGTAKDLAKYTQDYAGTKFNEGFNRDQATRSLTANLLSGVSNQGLGATNTGVNAGTNATNSIADLMTQGGNAQASGIAGVANAANSGAGNYVNWVNQSRTLDLLRDSSYSKPTAYGGGTTSRGSNFSYT